MVFASFSHLIIFYKSFIRSKIDYGSILYGSASNVQLQKIEIIQNKCLRYIIGALKSTPISALCAETGIAPLQFRRNYLTDRLLIKSISHPSSLLFKNIETIISRWRFTPTKLPLICRRASLIFKFQKYTYKLPPYRWLPFQFSTLFLKIPIYKLPNPTHVPA